VGQELALGPAGGLGGLLGLSERLLGLFALRDVVDEGVEEIGPAIK